MARKLHGSVLCLLAACFVTCGAWGDDDADDDVELFRTVLAARKKNHEKLLTWQGKAQMVLRANLASHGPLNRTTLIEFFLDRPNEAYLWRERVVLAKAGSEADIALVDVGMLAKEDILPIDQPDVLRLTATLYDRNGLYELSPLIRDPNGDWENALVIWPADDDARRRLRQFGAFDPRTHLLTWEGQDLDEMLTIGYEYIRQPDYGDRSIKRQGTLVIYRVKLKGTTWIHTFDLAKGGNLVSTEVSDSGHHSRDETEFVQVDGIWVPSLYKTKAGYVLDGGEKAGREKEIRFSEHVVNKALPKSAFTPAAMGIHEGCRIYDHRIDGGSTYAYDEAAIQKHPEWVPDDGEAAELPAVVTEAPPPAGVAEVAVMKSAGPTTQPSSNDASTPAGCDENMDWLYIAAGILLAAVLVAGLIRGRSRK